MLGTARRLLTAQEVADQLGITDQRVYAMIREGLLPGVRLGRSVRVEVSALEAYLAQGGQPHAGGWRKAR